MDRIEFFLIANESWLFLLEVMLRCVIAFTVVLCALRLTGKRGVRQLSLFEVVIIITLGSAAGDVAFYKEVGILPVIVTIGSIVLLYRFITHLLLKSKKLSRMLEGEPVTIIKNGRFTSAVIENENLSFDEFFMELRLCGVEQLGQVRVAILEVNGDVSVFKNDPENIVPGLSLLPEDYKNTKVKILHDGLYSCTHCGYTEYLLANDMVCCRACGSNKWTMGSNRGCP